MEKEEIKNEDVKGEENRCTLCDNLKPPNKYKYKKTECNDCFIKKKSESRRKKKEIVNQSKQVEYEQRIDQMNKLLELRQNIDTEVANKVFNELFNLKNKEYYNAFKKKMKTRFQEIDRLYNNMIANVNSNILVIKQQCIDEHEIIDRQFSGFIQTKSSELSSIKSDIRNILRQEVKQSGLLTFALEDNTIQMDDFLRQSLLDILEENRKLRESLNEIKNECTRVNHHNEQLLSFCNEINNKIEKLEDKVNDQLL